ncbi:hypothetical protein D043_4049 [Vibrio parahaemolyticus EKP-021]|nr:hypothetical protein D043_4049 [Vibrio parahaemolyticus EKP-021]
MPLASNGLILACSRERWENCSVNAVEELKPAKMEVNNMPRFAPPILIAK